MSANPPGMFAEKWRVARACARCHRLKSKCVYEDPSYDLCKRCYSLGIKCLVEEDPTARSAKRRAAVRPALGKIERMLAAVERELVAISENAELGCDDPDLDRTGLAAAVLRIAALLEPGAASLGPQTPLQAKPAILQPNQLLQPTLLQPPTQLPSLLQPAALPTLPPANLMRHAIDAGLLSEAEARLRYAFFLAEMLAYYPIVSLPAALEQYEHVLEKAPVLLTVCVYVTTFSNYGFGPAAQNRTLNQNLKALVDHTVAHTVFVAADNLSSYLVMACLILSLWCVPPHKVGQFRSQIDLIAGYGVSLCIDAGNLSLFAADAVALDDLVARNNLRCFLAVYCCCGLLTFSLPRFKLVSWTPRHALAVAQLAKAAPGGLPSRQDAFLCYYYELIYVGQQMYDYSAEHGVSMNLLTCEDTAGAKVPPPAGAWHKVVADLQGYETALTEIAEKSGLFETHLLLPLTAAPLEKYAVLLTYYHLVMMSHDNVVSWCIYRLTNDAEMPGFDADLIVSHIRRFGELCEKIPQCFIDLNDSGTTQYPTFFYYRTLTALVSLIRLSILVNSELLRKHFPKVKFVQFNLPALYTKTAEIVRSNSEKYSLEICERFSEILVKIGRWVNAVKSSDSHKHPKTGVDIDFIKFTDMSKGQEIEKLDVPATALRTFREKMLPIKLPDSTSPFDTDEHVTAGATPLPRFFSNFSINEMFKEIDEDIVRYLNPFDTMDNLAGNPADYFFKDF